MKRSLLFAATCAAAIAIVWVIARLALGETAQRALGIAATVALVVQVAAFLIAREFARKQNVMAGWGIGIALRFLTLMLFGLIVVPRFGLPLGTSLVALAMFLFVSTLIEPLFLKS